MTIKKKKNQLATPGKKNSGNMIVWKYKGQPLNKHHNIQGKSLLLPL